MTAHPCYPAFTVLFRFALSQLVRLRHPVDLGLLTWVSVVTCVFAIDKWICAYFYKKKLSYHGAL